MLRSLLRQLRARRTAIAATHSAGSPQETRQQTLAEAARLHERRQYAPLAAHCQAYLAVQGEDADLLIFLAGALAAQAEIDGAVDALERAIAVAPERGEARLTLARLQVRARKLDAARDAYRGALNCPECSVPAGTELCSLLIGLGRYDEAEACARAFSDQPTLKHALARALFEQGRVDQCIEVLRSLVFADDVSAAVHSDLLRALNYSDRTTPSAIYLEHRQWAKRHACSLSERSITHPNTAVPERRLRVGFSSPHFRKHAVTFFLESVLSHFDKEQVEIFLYSDAVTLDEYSRRLRSQAALWRNTAGLDDEAMAALVRSDAIDILVDLTGHTPGHRLLAFARRPAPVQITWNGYPNTSGMLAMGYRITDAHCDPPGETEALHTEALLRLPEVYMSFKAPADAGPVAPLPAGRSGTITFASFNGCYKLSPMILDLWRQILERTPSSRLLLVAVPPGAAEDRIRTRLIGAGVSQDRLAFRDRVSHEEFLEAHHDVDIALDAFPYHGTTTTCYSLWMGVPVITLAGRSHVSRVGVSLLTNVGHPELIGHDGDDYVRIACALASDRARLQHLRADLRTRMMSSPLIDGAKCARGLQGAWRSVWVQWCDTQRPHRSHLHIEDR